MPPARGVAGDERVVLGVRAEVLRDADLQAAGLQATKRLRACRIILAVKPQHYARWLAVAAGDRLDDIKHQLQPKCVGGERQRRPKRIENALAQPEVSGMEAGQRCANARHPPGAAEEPSCRPRELPDRKAGRPLLLQDAGIVLAKDRSRRRRSWLISSASGVVDPARAAFTSRNSRSAVAERRRQNRAAAVDGDAFRPPSRASCLAGIKGLRVDGPDRRGQVVDAFQAPRDFRKRRHGGWRRRRQTAAFRRD